MNDWIPPEAEEDKSMVTMLRFLLEEAKLGRLNGFSGVFLLEPSEEEDQGKHAVGLMSCHRLEELKYLTVGALEKIKADILK
jgi:hypothetical protein